MDGLADHLHAGRRGRLGEACRDLAGQQQGGQVFAELVAQPRQHLQPRDVQAEPVIADQGHGHFALDEAAVFLHRGHFGHGVVGVGRCGHQPPSLAQHESGALAHLWVVFDQQDQAAAAAREFGLGGGVCRGHLKRRGRGPGCLVIRRIVEGVSGQFRGRGGHQPRQAHAEARAFAGP